MDNSVLTLTTTRKGEIAPPNLGESYLKFEVGQGTIVGLPMKQVQEVVVLQPRYLTPVPTMEPEILGLMHRRSRVLWVIDLAMLLEVGRLDYSPQQYDIVILRTGSISIAAAIKRVDGIAWTLPEALQPVPSHVSKGLIPYSRGCLLQSQEIVFMLDGEAILQAPLLQHS
ncbi:chemotaxis protein CheW [Leptolyngbya sp. FACHB-17]|uniref:chemotaxis protein CheW n=1 Tax=unclassified Leptolyngbya TaxID=2650499 RepID=UPI0016812939|nr:chemotaxis protein CheW [Leptolyngbya sp. FACHB-17]